MVPVSVHRPGLMTSLRLLLVVLPTSALGVVLTIGWLNVEGPARSSLRVSEDCVRATANPDYDRNQPRTGLDYRCSCNTNGRFVPSWRGDVSARSLAEACSGAASRCFDYYAKDRSSGYVPPPDSFSQPSNPEELCLECQCMEIRQRAGQGSARAAVYLSSGS